MDSEGLHSKVFNFALSQDGRESIKESQKRTDDLRAEYFQQLKETNDSIGGEVVQLIIDKVNDGTLTKEKLQEMLEQGILQKYIEIALEKLENQ